MYLRTVHAEKSLPILRQLIRDNPLGILTTAIRSPGHPFMQSSHIPFLLDVEDDSSESEIGILRGHIARANPQAKAIISSFESSSYNADGHWLPEEVLVLFNSPAHHYITPKFYVDTKPATGKVVPTWNYAAVQAYGRARIYFDTKSPDTDSFLAKQVRELSHMGETKIMGYERPWSVDDAPEKYVELLKKAIVGIEVRIERLEGKFKMSQEMGEGDRKGVVDGLEALEGVEGDGVAGMVRDRTVKSSG